MTPAERLAGIVAALESVDLPCLVMGGHAVRFYGLARDTNDFDMKVSPDQWADLAERLSRTALFGGQPAIEGPSWRPNSFKRYRIGTLPGGQDEWLEFWRENHLLAPHAELVSRSERGQYGDREIRFLGLADLIRSKETERDADWQDVTRLEDFYDSRMRTRVKNGKVELAQALGQLRSRAVFGEYYQEGVFANSPVVSKALELATNPISQGYLIPFAPLLELSRASIFAMEPVVLNKLRSIEGGSSLHISLVEVLRRRYVQFWKDVDRRNKEAIRAGSGSGRE